MKVLIAYASRYGATQTIAEKLAGFFPAEAELVNLNEQTPATIEGFTHIFLGGPVYAGRLSSKVGRFAERFKDELQKIPCAIFLASLAQGARAQEYLEQSFPAWLLAHSSSREPVGGAITLSRMGFLTRFLLKKAAGISADKDVINYQAIERLAKTFLP